LVQCAEQNGGKDDAERVSASHQATAKPMKPPPEIVRGSGGAAHQTGAALLSRIPKSARPGLDPEARNLIALAARPANDVPATPRSM